MLLIGVFIVHAQQCFRGLRQNETRAKLRNLALVTAKSYPGLLRQPPYRLIAQDRLRKRYRRPFRMSSHDSRVNLPGGIRVE
jgi:hypothetical protein